MIKNILTIAGSDPSGGAGIQADLKTFSALGCYGMAALTALTAQNTKEVTEIHELPSSFVAAQLDAIFTDIRVDAVKIGMAGSPDVIRIIAQNLEKFKPPFIILDPVMAAQSGDSLLSRDSLKALKDHLIPLATILTPNIPEAKILLGEDYTSNQEDCAVLLREKLSAQSILLKGGHASGVWSTDIYADENGIKAFKAKRIETSNNHGTGCTLSAAIAVGLAQGKTPENAIDFAKIYINGALDHSHQLHVGHGAGPVHHFFNLWDKGNE